ncbi:MAG TPA: cytochrome c biogenesis protein CcsA [Candidatus Dormibacteraeota bacterium]|nr:cytochrome c biogenesis protein CcsA [Candidatus Dormibacteraeota bacterium]
MTENRRLHLLTVVALAGMLVAAGMIFLYAPQDALQGPVQRIFYLHVSSAIVAYACFALVVAGGVAYLWKESLRGDRLARAAAAVGLVFTTNAFVMGMIWAKPIWNWDPSKTWDARVTSTAVLWVVYAGYLLVRRFATPGRQAMRLAAVVGIVGFADVPIVHFSVQWWRTLHPGRVIDAPGGPALPPQMLLAFMVTMLAVLLLAGTLVAIRYRIEARRDALEERAVAAQLELAASPGSR